MLVRLSRAIWRGVALIPHQRCNQAQVWLWPHHGAGWLSANPAVGVLVQAKHVHCGWHSNIHERLAQTVQTAGVGQWSERQLGRSQKLRTYGCVTWSKEPKALCWNCPAIQQAWIGPAIWPSAQMLVLSGVQSRCGSCPCTNAISNGCKCLIHGSVPTAVFMEPPRWMSAPYMPLERSLVSDIGKARHPHGHPMSWFAQPCSAVFKGAWLSTSFRDRPPHSWNIRLSYKSSSNWSRSAFGHSGRMGKRSPKTGGVGIMGIGRNCGFGKLGLTNKQNHLWRLAGIRCSSFNCTVDLWKLVVAQKWSMMRWTAGSLSASTTHSSRMLCTRRKNPAWSNAGRVPARLSSMPLLSPNALHGWHENPPISMAGELWVAWRRLQTSGVAMSPWTGITLVCFVCMSQKTDLSSFTALTWTPHAARPVAIHPIPEQASMACESISKVGVWCVRILSSATVKRVPFVMSVTTASNSEKATPSLSMPPTARNFLWTEEITKCFCIPGSRTIGCTNTLIFIPTWTEDQSGS